MAGVKMKQSEQCYGGQEMDNNGFVMCNDRRLPHNGITSILAERGLHKISWSDKHSNGREKKSC